MNHSGNSHYKASVTYYDSDDDSDKDDSGKTIDCFFCIFIRKGEFSQNFDRYLILFVCVIIKLNDISQI